MTTVYKAEFSSCSNSFTRSYNIAVLLLQLQEPHAALTRRARPPTLCDPGNRDEYGRTTCRSSRGHVWQEKAESNISALAGAFQDKSGPTCNSPLRRRADCGLRFHARSYARSSTVDKESSRGSWRRRRLVSRQKPPDDRANAAKSRRLIPESPRTR